MITLYEIADFTVSGDLKRAFMFYIILYDLDNLNSESPVRI